MKRNTKFKLFSYIIENGLIQYRSIDKHKRIAFSIILLNSIFTVEKIILCLNHLLKIRILDYYSIEIYSEKNIKIMICIKSIDRNILLKNFNILKKEIEQLNIKFTLLSKNNLKENFIPEIFKNFNIKNSLDECDGQIIVKNHEIQNNLSLYHIHLKKSLIEPGYVIKILNFIRNYYKVFNIIFKFSLNRFEQIVFFPYLLIDNIDHLNRRNLKIESTSRNFFDYDFINKFHLKKKDFAAIIWRLEINQDFLLYKEFKKIFKFYQLNENIKKKEVFDRITDKLSKNNVDHVIINKNTLLINRNELILIFEKLDFMYIKDIINEYYSRFQIHIITSNKMESNRLKEIRNIKKLKKLYIYNEDTFDSYLNKRFSENS